MWHDGGTLNRRRVWDARAESDRDERTAAWGRTAGGGDLGLRTEEAVR